MANCEFLTTNIYTTSADQIESSSKNRVLGVGGIISAILFFVTPLAGLFSIAITFFVALSAGKHSTSLLRSGAEGEELVLRTLRNLPDNFYLFNQVHVPNSLSRKGFNEIDIALFGGKSVFIVEVKNHKGHIVGAENDDQWIVHKVGMRGTRYSKTMYNPIKQVKNQSYALQKHLRSKNLHCHIVPIVVLANPNCSFEIFTSTEIVHFVKVEQLTQFIITNDTASPNSTAVPLLTEIISLKKAGAAQ
jgi:hypothetical protein